ncbi:hypothetical protein BDN72DRAFT_897769 [Pluteus cervinus]|uniref:Uncharacterized protein n=1 Tax=Pluteus cervinus TaxID=181527 RepID=A0ACD3AV87_9AGAR|nr:hypothetical protein BDN72DRAFT_897769 [Pluteus cervinus]
MTTTTMTSTPMKELSAYLLDPSLIVSVQLPETTPRADAEVVLSQRIAAELGQKFGRPGLLTPPTNLDMSVPTGIPDSPLLFLRLIGNFVALGTKDKTIAFYGDTLFPAFANIREKMHISQRIQSLLETESAFNQMKVLTPESLQDQINAVSNSLHAALTERDATMASWKSEVEAEKKLQNATNASLKIEVQELKSAVQELKSKNTELEEVKEELETMKGELEAKLDATNLALQTKTEDCIRQVTDLTCKLTPLYLRFLLDETQKKLASALGEESWRQLCSAACTTDELVDRLDQAFKSKPADEQLPRSAIKFLCSSSRHVRASGNAAAHSAELAEIIPAIERRQGHERDMLLECFKFTYPDIYT